MKIAAVIAEYNPFHNGHLYQLQTLRGELNADAVLVIMSGDFTQRGIPAIVDKYGRCRMALENGADLVFELPVYFALGSAEYFAQGAVSLADKLGVVDLLHFGSECGNISVLKACAQLLANETPAYQEALNRCLKQGLSFPSARSRALSSLPAVMSVDSNICFNNILSSPNNILGVEYIKALLQRKSPITPVTLERKGSQYGSFALTPGHFASADAIRHALFKAAEIKQNTRLLEISELKEYLPESVFHYFNTVMQSPDNALMSADDFSGVLHYKLLMEHAKNENCFASFYDLNEQLSNTLCNHLPDFTGFTDFALLCKSKNLTYTRLSRCLTHILLDLKQEAADALKAADYSQYARVLGFNENGKKILKQIKANAALPIVTKLPKALTELPALARLSLTADIYAANVYQSVRLQKITRQQHGGMAFSMPNKLPNELTRQIIKLS